MDRQAGQNQVAEEAFIIQHAGEIPEVAYHSSLYYLTVDDDGPGLTLADTDIFSLKLAVVERYRTIILRDLAPENRDKTIYRGLARCAVNWRRLEKFCARQDMEFEAIRLETAAALRAFLQQEADDMQSGRRPSCINCPPEEVAALVTSLGLTTADLPRGWEKLCPVKVTSG